MSLKDASVVDITDGRSARRERGRTAVIDAVLELLEDGLIPPGVDDIAERAGVSVSSVFRYFDGLEDLQVQTLRLFQTRYLFLYDIGGRPSDSRDQRIRHFVGSRLRMFNEAGAIMGLARLRSLEVEAFGEAVETMRRRLADQVQLQFDTELQTLTPAKGAALAAAVDSFTSPEAWDVMRLSHQRSKHQIRNTWGQGLNAIFGAWVPERWA